MHSFFKFAALSGVGWLLDLALLLLLNRLLGLPLGGSNFVSSATAALVVFLMSRRAVFQAAPGALMRRAFIYLGYQSVGIVLASMAVHPLATWAVFILSSLGIGVSGAGAAFCGKVLITPPQLVANFLISRVLIQYRGNLSHER